MIGMLTRISHLVPVVSRNLTINACYTYKVPEADKVAVDNKVKVTEAQLRKFLELCWSKYVKARIEPGEQKAVILLADYAHVRLKDPLLAQSARNLLANLERR